MQLCYLLSWNCMNEVWIIILYSDLDKEITDFVDKEWMGI
jgi:hypothetical protein